MSDRHCQPDGGKCQRCGNPMLPIPRICPQWAVENGIPLAGARSFTGNQPQPLLGDRIEAALTAIGITKERWGQFVNDHGLPPGCGGCDQRQQKINDADQWVRDATARLGEKAMEAISTIWLPISRLRRKPNLEKANPDN